MHLRHLRLQAAVSDANEERHLLSTARTALILGHVDLWGHVVEAEFGYRTQHAYPALLYVNAMTGAVEHPVLQDIADVLARAYGITASLAARWDYF
jgi:hypothetical protein